MKGDRPGGPIRWKMHIKAPPEVVFEALNSDTGREAFWAESSHEMDGEIDLRFINGISTRAKVLERRPPDLLVLEYFGSLHLLDLINKGLSDFVLDIGWGSAREEGVQCAF